MNTSIAFFLRNHLGELPYSIGKHLSKVPYLLRPGIGLKYQKTKRDIETFQNLALDKKKEYILCKIKSITEYAYNNIYFYKKLYDQKRFNPERLKTFKDIQHIPVTTKSMFMQFDLEQRSKPGSRSMLINTGGSFGQTLSLYIPPDKFGIEWAHLHYIWKKQLNFKPSELKLLIVGRSKVKNFVSFDFIRNSLRVDIYKPFAQISNRILSDFRDAPIYYIHGYPSAISELAHYCENDKPFLSKILSDLKGIILCSEYPDPPKRELIENVFKVKSYSFYGHTEGCVMAYEDSDNNYLPLHTYGFIEAISKDDSFDLIGTSYFNTSSPFIRYNTEDRIENLKVTDDLLVSFSMKTGRPNEYITDRNGKKIPLTGLIYGRHHRLFEFCTSIQIKQTSDGYATVFYVPKNELKTRPEDLFDSENVDIIFNFKSLNEPIRTVSGKVRLLVR